MNTLYPILFDFQVMDMTGRKRIISMTLAVFLTALVLMSAVFLSERDKKFNFFEKSTIAMGTVVTQKVYSDNPGTAIRDIISIVNGLEDMISWRKENSAVAKLNKNGTVENKYLGEIIYDMQSLSRLTEGKFDLTVGRVSRLWGIGEENQRVPTENEIKEALETVGTDKVKAQGYTLTVDEGTLLDLGAIGKGYACDLVYNYLSSTDINGAIISVGGSVVAYGDYNKKGDKWRIAVTHPRDEEKYLGVISIDEGFVSTSGDYERYFEKDGKRYHHILDATTGYPADSGLISVTVVAESGVISDALSTACLLVGEKKAIEILEGAGASAILVDENLNITTVGEIEFEQL